MPDDNKEKKIYKGGGKEKSLRLCFRKKKNNQLPNLKLPVFLLSPKFTHLPEDQKNYFPVE